VGGDQHVGGLALHQLEGLAEQGAHDRALVLVDGADGQRAQRDGRVHADGERHRQRLAARLGDLVELPQVLAEGEMDRGPVAPLDHQAVVGAVPGSGRRVLGEGDGGGHVGAGVPLVVDDLGQRAQVHVVAALHDLLHGAGGDHAGRQRPLHRAQIGLLHTVGGGVDGRGQAAAAGVQVGEDGPRGALDVLEEEHRPPAPLLLELGDERGDLVDRVHGLGHDLEVRRAGPLDEVQETPKILRHHASSGTARRSMR
jgi:hypothetical protein